MVKGKFSCLCRLFGIFVAVIFVSLTAITAEAGTYSGGTGEPNDPYLISTPEELNTIGEDANDWDKHFKLMADVDMNGVEYNIIAGGSETWDYQGEPFVGSFDGDGHIIKKVTVNVPNQSYIGLFGYVGTGGEIKNLKLENVNLKGYSYAGAVAGENKGSIINCFSEVNIQVDYRYAGGIVGENDGNISLSSSFSNIYGYAALGGLVGWNNGTIDKCDSKGVARVDIACGPYCGGLVGYNKGDILNSVSNSTVYGGSSDVGGFAGTNRGMIENCHSNGYVSGTAYSAGGLIGYNSRGKIYNCYSEAEVSGKYYIGGLVGWDKSGYISGSYAAGNVLAQEEVGGLIGWMTGSSITNCYSTGDVNGIEYIGGLSGGINGTGSIINCYATGKVIGNENTGGLLGYNTLNTGIIIESFWDFESSDIMTSVGGSGKSTAEMQTAATFINAGWDFNTPIWTIDEGFDYPRLWWETPIEPVDLVIELSENVDTMSLQKGVTNSLQVILDTALRLLEDENEHNDSAAINSLQAFINAVNAQRGKKISEEDADYLVTAAQQIIDLLSSE